MSKRSKNSLLNSSGRSGHSTTAKDELLAMKYTMNHPMVSVYPYNEMTQDDPNTSKTCPKTYPDYKPWRDHTQMTAEEAEVENSKITNSAYLNKGYFEPPIVSNEYYSARNMVQRSLFSSTESCHSALSALSSSLSAAYHTRNKSNKITSSTFKLPSRVTLTASKRDAWFKDLASRDVELSSLAPKIPHGVKNKVLVEVLVSKEVPIERAIWFTKTVLMTESGKRRKDEFLADWTMQLTDYLYKYLRDAITINTIEKKAIFTRRLDYLLEYIKVLYIECLIDRVVFLARVISFFPEEDQILNVSNTTPSSTAVNTFTSPVGPSSYKSPGIHTPANFSMAPINNVSPGQQRHFSSHLEPPLRLVALSIIQTYWEDVLKSDRLCSQLAENLLLVYRKNSLIAKSIHKIVNFLFRYNSNLFIFAKSWQKVGDTLETILECTGTEHDLILKQLQIVKYRNESLVLVSDGQFRASDDLLAIIEKVDQGKLLEVKMTPSVLKLLLHHCVTIFRVDSPILAICAYIKHHKPTPSAEYINSILEIMYDLAENHYTSKTISSHKLYILVNELYQLKLFTISAYLRKLISSGLFYGSGSATQSLMSHLLVLKNLPIINNRQCDNILKKYHQQIDFQNLFDKGCQVVEEEIMSKCLCSVESNLTFIYDLPIGLQFLVVNYTTNRIKQFFGSSQQLIHITSEIIAVLYNFYKKCGSLTAFINGVLKLILKDEGVLIYEMDVLRFIGRLLLRHKQLADVLTHCSPQPTSSVYMLLVKSYSELSSREPDFLEFQSVWNMIKESNEDLSMEFKSANFTEVEKDELLNQVGLAKVELYSLLNKLAGNEVNEIPVVKLLSTLKDDPTFNPAIKSFLSSNKSLILAQKLIIFDVIEISLLSDIVPNLLVESPLVLPESQKISLAIEIEQFYTTNTSKLIQIVRSNSSALALQYFINCRFKEAVAEFTSSKWSVSDVLKKFEELLGTSLTNIKLDDIWTTIPINEFSLPIIQILIQMIFKNYDEADIIAMLDIILKNLCSDFRPDNSFFGELFRYLEWNQKLIILDKMEKYFLIQANELLKNFDAKDDNDKINKTFNEDGGSIKIALDYYKDFFTKFPVTANISTSPSLISQLSSLSVKFAQIVNENPPNSYDLMSIYFRILIIHKQALYTDQILIHSLLQILNSKYLLSNDKLHILLYDLLSFQRGRPGMEMLTLPELTFINTLADYVTPLVFPCSLDEKELSQASDFHILNGHSLDVISNKTGSQRYHFKSYEILENLNGDLNGGCINISLFDAYISKQNPP